MINEFIAVNIDCATMLKGKSVIVTSAITEAEPNETAIGTPKNISIRNIAINTWIYQGAMSFTGAANEWFLKQFYGELRGLEDVAVAYRIMNHDATKADPGSGGVIFLPYMLGERSPIWDPYARGVFFGISTKTTRRDMNRAVLEGCGYGLRQMCEIAQQITGNAIESFTSIGGGAKSDVWAQIKADITERVVKVLDIHDMAPIGAALLAGVGVGIFKDVY